MILILINFGVKGFLVQGRVFHGSPPLCSAYVRPYLLRVGLSRTG